MKKHTGKKVLAIITGIGYGHSIREVAVLNILKSKGYDIVVAGYANSYEYFEFKFDTLELQGPKFPERKFNFSPIKVAFKNLLLPLKYISNYFKLKKVCKIFKPDIILTDFEPIAFSLEKKKPHFLIFNFDPELYKEYKKEHQKKFKIQHSYIHSIYKKALKTSTPIIVPSISGRQPNKIHYVDPIIREVPKK
ncbi:MAG: hypothetical protein CMH62_01205 [Nanoarchaeota archaeon]|nr:hypothetical protein [Nanoarchaeota archaeon]